MKSFVPSLQLSQDKLARLFLEIFEAFTAKANNGIKPLEHPTYRHIEIEQVCPATAFYKQDHFTWV
jgi:hypothetical protein